MPFADSALCCVHDTIIVHVGIWLVWKPTIYCMCRCLLTMFNKRERGGIKRLCNGHWKRALEKWTRPQTRKSIATTMEQVIKQRFSEYSFFFIRQRFGTVHEATSETFLLVLISYWTITVTHLFDVVNKGAKKMSNNTIASSWNGQDCELVDRYQLSWMKLSSKSPHHLLVSINYWANMVRLVMANLYNTIMEQNINSWVEYHHKQALGQTIFRPKNI